MFRILLNFYWATRIRPALVAYLDKRLSQFSEAMRIAIDKRFGASAHLIIEEIALKPARDKAIEEIDEAFEGLLRKVKK